MMDRCEAARRVFIAIPAYSAMLAFDTAFALISAALCLKDAGIGVQMKGLEGNCYVDAARNELVGDFLASDATDLLFWDADVGCMPATVMRLVKATRPVVAAIYPKKTDDEEYPVDFLKGAHTLDGEGLIEAKMVPTGLLRINRRVFEAMAPTLKTYKGRDRELHAYFETDIREAYHGEDVEFCRKWRELGGKIRVAPDETLSHTGPKAWIGNVGHSLRQGKF
jgi:hypothetical protein